MKRGLLLAIWLCLSVVPAFAAELIVSAASSLTNAFAEMGKEFEAENPGVKVYFNFAASGSLLAQLENGAPADVYASADSEMMERAVKKGIILAGTSSVFAQNRLVLAVSSNSAIAITALADLAKPAVTRIALGDPAFVPAGRYAKEKLEAAGLWTAVKTKLHPCASVRQAANYVALGEADVGFVYQSDAVMDINKLHVLEVLNVNDSILYDAGVVASTANLGLAKRFTEYLAGQTAQKILKRYGFEEP